MEYKKRQAKRYRLHYKIRKQGFILNTKERTIYIFPDSEPSKQIKVLKSEFDYMIQYTITQREEN